METVLAWLQQSAWGIPHWVMIATAVFAVLERLLIHSKRPELRSLVGVIAMAMRWILMTTKVGRIPVLGTTVVVILESIAGVDIDGDGKVGRGDPGAGGGPLALAMLAAWMAIPACSWLRETTKDAGDCGMEAAKEVELLPVVRRILADPRQDVVFTELINLGVKFGADFVDCMVARVLAGDAGPVGATSEGAIIHNNGRAWLESPRAGGARPGGEAAP